MLPRNNWGTPPLRSGSPLPAPHTQQNPPGPSFPRPRPLNRTTKRSENLRALAFHRIRTVQNIAFPDSKPLRPPSAHHHLVPSAGERAFFKPPPLSGIFFSIVGFIRREFRRFAGIRFSALLQLSNSSGVQPFLFFFFFSIGTVDTNIPAFLLRGWSFSIAFRTVP